MRLSARRCALALAATLAAGAPVGASAATKIVVGSISAPDYLGTYVAIKEGYFAKRDLDVTLQSLAGGVVLPAMQAGTTQIAGIPITNILLGVEGGLDIRIVAGATVTLESNKSYGMVVGPDLATAGAKDLVGKKIAVPAVGGVMYIMAANWLIKNGVKVKDVGWIETTFDKYGDLLKSGSIHAGSSLEPLMTRAADTSGGKIVHYFSQDFGANTAISIYATSGKWADENPEAARKFEAGVKEGSDFINKNPEKAKLYLAEYSKLPAEVTAKMILPAYGGDAPMEQIVFWRDTMVELGILKKAVDVSKMRHR
jgi:NitT/TauT family transport system substrate-binding protein